MSKTWKWILVIALGLVILAGAGFVAANFFGFGHMSFWGGSSYGRPMMDDYAFGDRIPRGGYQNFRHPMMGGRGFYPLGGFFFLGGLLRLFFPLAILAAVGYFAYQKGKKDGATQAALPPVPAAEPSQSDEES